MVTAKAKPRDGILRLLFLGLCGLVAVTSAEPTRPYDQEWIQQMMTQLQANGLIDPEGTYNGNCRRIFSFASEAEDSARQITQTAELNADGMAAELGRHLTTYSNDLHRFHHELCFLRVRATTVDPEDPDSSSYAIA